MESTQQPRFDPAGYFEFDLARGQVRAQGGERVLILGADVVGPLVSAAVQNGDLTAVRALGKRVGERVARGLGSGDVAERPPEQVLGYAAGMLALLGWGRLGFERWGDALVAHVVDAPSLDDERLAVAALLGGVLTSLAKREVACVPVGDDEHFVVVDPAVAEEIFGWTKEGVGLAELIGRLQPGGRP